MSQVDIEEAADIDRRALRAVLPELDAMRLRIEERYISEHTYVNRTGLLESLTYSEAPDPETGRVRIGNHASYSGWVEVGHFIHHGTTPRKTALTGGWVHGRPSLLPALLAEAAEGRYV